MYTSEESYINVLKRHSNDLIKSDGMILANLLLNVRDSAVALSLIPFCALYCRSAKEFLCIENTGNGVEKEVKDIRDGLKIFTGKFSKGKRMAVESDNQQNEVFRNKLNIPLAKELNIHLNLGVYFNKQGRIVFNTQLANYYLSIPENKEQSSEEHAWVVGVKLSSEIGQILTKHCGVNDLMGKKFSFNPVPKYGYIDLNTNRDNEFFNKDYDKEINLIFLHMLSTIGFVNNLLIPVFKDRNVWLLRVIYITVHNTWLGIKKVMQHLEQNYQGGEKESEFVRCFDENIKLFSSAFRNCMMHYDLVDKSGCPVILPEYYDPEKPLYGLIESCYNGMHFYQYYDKLYKLSQDLEEYLLSYFTIDITRIIWDWSR